MPVIVSEHIAKEYRLGQIGGGSLRRDLQSWWARKRGLEDPNRKLNVGARPRNTNERFIALDDINFAVEQGDALGLIGRNGAGKSTLLKLIARITAPTRGRILERGRVASMLEVGTGFHPELTGRENVYLNGAILGMSRAEISRKMDEIIDFSEIEQFIDTPVKRYSSGMYVKLAFSVAAHLEPEILICDEVLAVGDIRFQQKCLGKMGDIAGGGRTVLYVSHNMRTIEQLCSRAICLDAGRIIYDGNVDEAIVHYAGANANKGVFFDLTDRPRNAQAANGCITMNAIRLTNTLTCQFPLDGQIEFDLGWTANSDLADVQLRAVVISAAEQPVAAIASEAFANPKRGDRLSSKCALNLGALAPGEYRVTLVMFRANGVGMSINLDNLNDVFRFEVMDDVGLTGGLQWQTRWWGSARLGGLDVH